LAQKLLIKCWWNWHLLSHFLTICPPILFVLLFSRTYFLLFFLYHPQSFSSTCSLSFSLVLSSYFSFSLVFSCSLSFSRLFLVLSSSFSPFLSISQSLSFYLTLTGSFLFSVCFLMFYLNLPCTLFLSFPLVLSHTALYFLSFSLVLSQCALHSLSHSFSFFLILPCTLSHSLPFFLNVPCNLSFSLVLYLIYLVLSHTFLCSLSFYITLSSIHSFCQNYQNYRLYWIILTLWNGNVFEQNQTSWLTKGSMKCHLFWNLDWNFKIFSIASTPR